jgi:hypothetical protein
MSALFLVIATFVIGMLIIFITLRNIIRMKLSLVWSIIFISLGVGLGFGTIGFMATFSDDSSSNWTIFDRLAVGGEFFTWTCFGTFVLIPVAMFIAKQLKVEK